MPIYEYQCAKCSHKFEVLQKMSDDPVTVCPVCKEPAVKRLISAAAFHLKGSGWYKTDYGSKNGNGSKSSVRSKEHDGKKEEAPEAKPEAKEAKSDSAPAKDAGTDD